MQDLWQEAGEEPSIAELLDDPIAHLLRAYDGLEEDDVWLAVEQACCQLSGHFQANWMPVCSPPMRKDTKLESIP